jgi:hypothetical protein
MSAPNDSAKPVLDEDLCREADRWAGHLEPADHQDLIDLLCDLSENLKAHSAEVARLKSAIMCGPTNPGADDGPETTQLVDDLREMATRAGIPAYRLDVLKIAADRLDLLYGSYLAECPHEAEAARWQACNKHNVESLTATKFALESEVAELRATIERVEAVHRPFGIYDECGHDHKAPGGEVHDIEDVGLTCARLYEICRECCTADGEWQTEECIDHDHRAGRPICDTIAALDGPQKAST